jgi:hypothetical protein
MARDHEVEGAEIERAEGARQEGEQVGVSAAAVEPLEPARSHVGVAHSVGKGIACDDGREHDRVGPELVELLDHSLRPTELSEALVDDGDPHGQDS